MSFSFLEPGGEEQSCAGDDPADDLEQLVLIVDQHERAVIRGPDPKSLFIASLLGVVFGRPTRASPLLR
jgi:hypothetical protein